MNANEILINLVYYRNDGYCFYCDKRLSYQNYGIVGSRGAWEIDHFIPFSRNGADKISNFVPACIDCNSRKADLMPWEFNPYRFPYCERDPDKC